MKNIVIIGFFVGIIIFSYMIIMDSDRVHSLDRIEFLENRSETLYNMIVDAANIQAEQTEQIENIKMRQKKMIERIRED